MKRNFKLGVTLMEMLIVLAIISILVAVIVPSVSYYIPGIQLSGTARTLSGNLREAQEKAVAEQNQHLVRFFPSGNPPYYQLIRIYNSNEELIRQVNLSTDLTLTLESAITNNQIIFSADGGPSSSGNITLSLASGAQKVINVSPAGFIKIP